jgi:hypothetical protein
MLLSQILSSLKLFFAVLLFVTLTPGLARAAEANEASKPKASASAVSEAGFVVSIINRFNAAVDSFCSPSQPGLVNVAFSAKKIVMPRDPSELKDDRELRQYLKCYTTSATVWEQIDKTYLPIIESAARTYGLPKTMLACLIFAESTFNPKAESDSGAFGLGQHTQIANDEFTRILKNDTEEEIAENERKVASTPEEVAKWKTMSVATAKIAISHADTRVIQYGFARKWDDYFKDLNRRRIYDGNAPKIMNDQMLSNPAISIGASAFYLHMMMTHLKRNLDKDIVVSRKSADEANVDLLLAAAGSYNIGPGSASYVLRKIEPPDRKAWVEALMKSNEETARYITKIQNCLSPSSSKTQGAFLPPPNSFPYSCEPPLIASGAKHEMPRKYNNVLKSASDLKVHIKELKEKAAQAKALVEAKAEARKAAAAKQAAVKAANSAKTEKGKNE